MPNLVMCWPNRSMAAMPREDGETVGVDRPGKVVPERELAGDTDLQAAAEGDLDHGPGVDGLSTLDVENGFGLVLGDIAGVGLHGDVPLDDNAGFQLRYCGPGGWP